MNEQQNQNDDIPDYSPLPEPGDLVMAAFKRYALTQDDWDRFVRALATRTRQVKTMRGHLERGVDVAPGWKQYLSDQLQHEADRLEGLGEPSWRLWNAFAQEARLSSGD